MTRKIKQRRVDRPALRPPFRVLAVLLGLLSLYIAISQWRSFPVLTLLFAVIFLVSCLGATSVSSGWTAGNSACSMLWWAASPGAGDRSPDCWAESLKRSPRCGTGAALCPGWTRLGHRRGGAFRVTRS